MKTIRYLIAVLLFGAFVACQKPFVKEYGLEVDSNEYVVSINGKTFPVYVYCSSAWTAEFDSPVDWAEIVEGESGRGVGMVKLNVYANYGEARSVNLILRSGSYEQLITIRQNEYVVDFYVSFSEQKMEIAAGSYFVKARFITNIPPEVLVASRATAEVKWISGITSYNVLSDNQIIGTNRKIEAEFSFVVLENETADSRTATFNSAFPAEYTEGMERVQSLTLVQTSEPAFITVEAPLPYSSQAQECSLPVTSNISALFADMTVSSSEPFVNNVRIEYEGHSEYLKFSLPENTSGSSREATLTLSYCDLSGKTSKASVKIHQN